MQKYFNVESYCIPEEHYMVNMDSRLKEIRQMVDAGKYFIINRGRQYGKTTTLNLLVDTLGDDYAVIFMDFQGLSSASFQNEKTFSIGFMEQLGVAVKTQKDLTGELDEQNFLNLKRENDDGIAEAVKIIVRSKIVLFDSMKHQIDIFPDLKEMLREVIYQGRKIPFSADN